MPECQIGFAYFNSSQPPLTPGLHLTIRLTPLSPPASTPYLSTACLLYSEQLGLNLQ